jgi:tRNA-intron endonuclease
LLEKRGLTRLYSAKEHFKAMQQANAVYNNLTIQVPSRGEADSLLQDGYGHTSEKRCYILEPYEALYLVEKERLTVIDEEERHILSFQEILNRELVNDPMLWTRYIIYRDIRGRGFVAKSTAKNDVSFSVYERGDYPKKAPIYELYALVEGIPETLGHIEERLVEVRNSGRALKLAVIDRRGELVYYGLDKLEPERLGADALK